MRLSVWSYVDKTRARCYARQDHYKNRHLQEVYKNIRSHIYKNINRQVSHYTLQLKKRFVMHCNGIRSL